MMDDAKRMLALTNILHLTDFSLCSDVALRWAIDVARANGAKLSVLHVVVPDALTYLTPDSPEVALDIQEKWAQGEMQRREGQLTGLPHDSIVKRGRDVSTIAEQELRRLGSELIVLGTHGKTGLAKLLLGSVAERVLRTSSVPVLTVGPGVAQDAVADGKFHRVLLATDFASTSEGAAEYAMALAERDQAQLVVLHACKTPKRSKADRIAELSVAEALHRIDELLRSSDRLPHRPETLVQFGDAGTRILEVAKRTKADLIVMGVRKAGSILATTHLEIGTAHNVVAHAPCPVLTVRPMVRQAA